MALKVRTAGIGGFVLALALVAPDAGRAQAEAPSAPDRVIRVVGEGVVPVEPDRAWLDVAVVTEARSADEAARANAARADALVQTLRPRLGEAGEIRSIGYAVSPRYRYPREGGKPEIVGYTATHSIQVRTAELERVGALVDAATEGGANQVRSLSFRLADDEAARAQALARAATRARAKARAIAEALGVEIARLRRIEEMDVSEPPVVRQAAALRAERADVPTPIEAGALEIRARVVLEAEIKD